MPSVTCPDWELVVPGSPERSNLYQKVASDSPPCGERMPPGETLSATEIDCIADVSASFLMEKLTSNGSCGGTQMPKDGPPLAQDQLDAIGSWICAGAPDN